MVEVAKRCAWGCFRSAAWLTTVCTLRWLDMLRSARRTRIDYIGAWLPEPIQTMTEETPESIVELFASLSLAFLLMLERLAPKERAAFQLREIFDLSYEDVAATLRVQEAACRKLVSRARSRIRRAELGATVPKERQDELLAAFQTAVKTEMTAQLWALMTQDIELRAGGGKVPTLLMSLFGKTDVLNFLAKPFIATGRVTDGSPPKSTATVESLTSTAQTSPLLSASPATCKVH